MTWFSIPVLLIALGAAMFFFRKPRILGGKNDRIAAVALVLIGLVMGGWLVLPAVGQSVGAGAITSATVGSSPSRDGNTTGVSLNTHDKHQVDIAIADAVLADDDTFFANVTLTRTGGADALIVPATCSAPDHRNPGDSTDVNEYNIVTKDVSGALECYIGTEQGAGSVGFTEGEATATVELSWDISESGHDKTDQYDNRYVYYDLGGQQIVFKVTRLEATA